MESAMVSRRIGFGLTEPDHGFGCKRTSKRRLLPKKARTGVNGWLINGEKMWTTGMKRRQPLAPCFATDQWGGNGDGARHHLLPSARSNPRAWKSENISGPSTHADGSSTREHLRCFGCLRVAILGRPDHGLALAQSFVHQKPHSPGGFVHSGAAVYLHRGKRTLRTSTASRSASLWRITKPSSFPLVELATQAEMLRLLIRKDCLRKWMRWPREQITDISDRISMCNYWANRPFAAKRLTGPCRCMAP